MIKIFAAIFMLLDHIGVMFFYFLTPQYKILRMIGRLSMPMFGYCIARGFYYSEKKGKTNKYLRNLLIFSIISQIPFSFVDFAIIGTFNLKNYELNIGFTWLFALIILKMLTKIKKPFKKEQLVSILIIVAIVVLTFFVRMDYGLYGVCFPIVFYFFMFKSYNLLLCFFANLILYLYNCIVNSNVIFDFKNSQIISIFAIFLIVLLKQNENRVKMPKKFFYWFYPAHLSVLIIIKMFVIENIESYNLFFLK